MELNLSSAVHLYGKVLNSGRALCFIFKRFWSPAESSIYEHSILGFSFQY